MNSVKASLFWASLISALFDLDGDLKLLVIKSLVRHCRNPRENGTDSVKVSDFFKSRSRSFNNFLVHLYSDVEREVSS